jgi:hypothetical protein
LGGDLLNGGEHRQHDKYISEFGFHRDFGLGFSAELALCLMRRFYASFIENTTGKCHRRW